MKSNLISIEYSLGMTMTAEFHPSPAIAEQVIERIFTLRKIDRTDQRLLMSALLSKKSLSDKERVQINRVFDALQRGLIKVVD